MVSKSEVALQWPVFQPRGWGTPTKARAIPRPWHGLDTERDADMGEFVCGWTVGDTMSKGEKEFVAPFKKLTDFQPGTYWIWNLGYDLEGLLRDLRIEEGWAARADGAAFELLGGRAIYYHGKRFDWAGPNGRVRFLEASSFFGRCRLSEIGAKGGVDASTMSLERYENDDTYRAEVDKYCIQDARIVYNAIVNLADGLQKLRLPLAMPDGSPMNGIEIGATPGATARRFLALMGPFPDVLWRTQRAFLAAYGGGRFEVAKRGIFWDVNEYDLVSAYPHALSKCPWLTASAYARATRRFSDNALYGSYLISFDYNDYLGVAPRWRNGVRVYSRAEEKTWLARPEVGWLLKQGATVKIHRGIEIFDENATNLWEQVITHLFELKQKYRKESVGLGAKIVLNSMYGVLIQLIRKSGKWVSLLEAVNPVDFAGLLALEEPPKAFEAGKYYAPVYAGNLTSLTRVRILDAGQAVGPENYIAGHTDSVMCFGKLPLSLSKELGGWEWKKHAERAQVSKTGMYSTTGFYFGTLGGLDETVKIRGITKQGAPSLLWQDTFTRNARRGIKSADSWDEVSVITPKATANNWVLEQKRHWLRDLNDGIIAREEYVDSEALAHVC